MPSKSEQVRELLAQGLSTAEIAKKVGCSRNLVYVVKSQGQPATRKGRPQRAPQVRASRAGDPLGDLVQRIRELQRERDELRVTLSNVARIVDEALA